LARGIDAAAHEGALGAGGTTVAVVGAGVDVVYPPEHDGLAERIERAGAIVSEFPPGTAPQRHHFPLRNRLLSGLSRTTVVVEAPAASGALITARYALDQGRDVLAVPGPVAGGRNAGAHALIRDGARLVESAADVLEHMGWTRSTAASRDLPWNEPVVAALQGGGSVPFDDIARSTGLPAAMLLARLSTLEVAGLVSRDPGGWYVTSRLKVVR
jgi:DNA processing protein